MRNRIRIIAAIVGLVIGASVLALGHGFQGQGGHRRGPGHGDMVEHLSRELNLTDAQKEQVKAIMASAEASAQGIHAKLDEVRKQIDAATANGQFDETQVRTLASQQAQLEAEMMVEHLRAKSKVFGILTAEQRAKAEEMHKRMGPMRRHGPPPAPPSEE
jgi:Spy/CpxP family protein refolding chaperone